MVCWRIRYYWIGLTMRNFLRLGSASNGILDFCQGAGRIWEVMRMEIVPIKIWSSMLSGLKQSLLGSRESQRKHIILYHACRIYGRNLLYVPLLIAFTLDSWTMFTKSFFFYLHTSMILIATTRAFKELVDLDHELLVHARRYKGSRLHHPIYRR